MCKKEANGPINSNSNRKDMSLKRQRRTPPQSAQVSPPLTYHDPILKSLNISVSMSFIRLNADLVDGAGDEQGQGGQEQEEEWRPNLLLNGAHRRNPTPDDDNKENKKVGDAVSSPISEGVKKADIITRDDPFSPQGAAALLCGSYVVSDVECIDDPPLLHPYSPSAARGANTVLGGASAGSHAGVPPPTSSSSSLSSSSLLLRKNNLEKYGSSLTYAVLDDLRAASCKPPSSTAPVLRHRMREAAKLFNENVRDYADVVLSLDVTTVCKIINSFRSPSLPPTSVTDEFCMSADCADRMGLCINYLMSLCENCSSLNLSLHVYVNMLPRLLFPSAKSLSLTIDNASKPGGEYKNVKGAVAYKKSNFLHALKENDELLHMLANTMTQTCGMYKLPKKQFDGVMFDRSGWVGGGVCEEIEGEELDGFRIAMGSRRVKLVNC